MTSPICTWDPHLVFPQGMSLEQTRMGLSPLPTYCQGLVGFSHLILLFCPFLGRHLGGGPHGRPGGRRLVPIRVGWIFSGHSLHPREGTSNAFPNQDLRGTRPLLPDFCFLCEEEGLQRAFQADRLETWLSLGDSRKQCTHGQHTTWRPHCLQL